jgi:uncharacterized protein (DUF885 family)
MLGIDGHDDRSPDLSAAAQEQAERDERRFLQRFESFPTAGLGPDERIDRDLAVSALRGRAALHDWQEWRRSPDGYLSASLMGVFSLFLRRPLPERELVNAAAKRLLAIPELLAAGRANLDADLAPPLLVERATRQCHAGATYARDLVPAEATSDEGRSKLAAAGGVAAAAFDDFAAFLEGLGAHARGTYAIGEARYSAILRQQELLGYGAEELRRRGRDQYDELDDAMTKVAREIRDTDDWMEVLHDLHAHHPATPDEMRAAYEDETRRCREFLVRNRLVTLPAGERCDVVPSPAFQRPVLAVASYFQPPPFKPTLVGRFNVPYPPEGTPPEDVAQRLANNSWAAIPTVTAHEAYPGHHWHLTTMAGARKLRHHLRSTYFTDPKARLGHLEARIFRAARIVVDTSLHIGDMDVEAAVTYMRNRAGLSEPVARAEVARYCAWPTQASAYLTGSLEIERLRDAWMATSRDPLRHFHDTLAASGGLPIALAERAIGLG